MLSEWWMVDFDGVYAASVDGSTAAALILAANSEKTPMRLSTRTLSEREIDERMAEDRESRGGRG
jgi:hypothetical protein